MRVRAATAAAGLILLVQCSTALAKQPVVHVDPGSPAGKQYAIPISSARSEAAGQTGSHISQSPPAFGVGITPSGSTAPVTGRPHATHRNQSALSVHKKGDPRRGSRGAHSSDSSPDPPAALPNSSVQVARAGGSGWLALMVGGVLVLALGGAGGFALRRRSG
jgi:hypothetical protein